MTCHLVKGTLEFLSDNPKDFLDSYVHSISLDWHTKWAKRRWDENPDPECFVDAYGDVFDLILIDNKIYKIYVEEAELDNKLDIKKENGKVFFSGYYYDDNTTLIEQLSYHI